MKNIVLSFLLLFTISPTIHAQNLERVHKTLDTLCSQSMHGRGAAFDGQKLAANYLANRFQEIGLAPLGTNYFQYFNYNINTFPKNISLKLDNKALNSGIDFIVEAGSPSGTGTLKLFVLDTLIYTSKKRLTAFLKLNLKKTALVYDETVAKKLKAAPKNFLAKLASATCIVELKDKKLTMALSQTQSKTIIFEVLKAKFDLLATTISYTLDAELLKNYQAQNIVGQIKGSVVPDSFLVITAHYDHLGTHGSTAYFPGANDNGSGVSMMLELANYFKEHPQRYSIVFIAFGAEEAGLIGSKYFTENPLLPLPSIRFLINVDLMGTGDDGMMVVNGTLFPKAFELLSTINSTSSYLPVIKKRGKAANSDHYFFTEKGVPTFFFYTLGGIAAYHDVQDIPSTLPLTKFSEVYTLITRFVTALSSE